MGGSRTGSRPCPADGGDGLGQRGGATQLTAKPTNRLAVERRSRAAPFDAPERRVETLAVDLAVSLA